jgi:hypothetical protein
MDTAFHPLRDLFEQLGLRSECDSIKQFIALHAPLDPQILLAEASFWTPGQKEFLREELLKDANWVEAIDLLNSQLREPR